MRKLLVKIAVRLGLYQKAMDIDTRIRQRKEKKAMQQYGLETLIAADEAITAFGGRMFLVFGTLLGAYREHNFIPHDCDIDVGLLASERPENIQELMAEAGFRRVNQQYVKETGRIVEERYQRKGVGIDLFYFFDDDRFPDEIYAYLSYRHETKDWREANVTDGFPTILKPQVRSTLSRQDFLGHQFYMPDRAEEWLRRLYGDDFMIPNPGWSFSDHKTRSFPSGERVFRKIE